MLENSTACIIIVWFPGCFVSSIGIDKHTIQKYVELQGQLLLQL